MSQYDALQRQSARGIDVFTFKLPDSEKWDIQTEISQALKNSPNYQIKCALEDLRGRQLKNDRICDLEGSSLSLVRETLRNSWSYQLKRGIEDLPRYQLEKARLSALERLSLDLARNYATPKAIDHVSLTYQPEQAGLATAAAWSPSKSAAVPDVYAGFLDFGEQQAQLWNDYQERQAEQVKQAVRDVLQEEEPQSDPEQPTQAPMPQQAATTAPPAPTLAVVASLSGSASMPIVEEARQRLAAHGITEMSVANYIDLCKTQGDRNEVTRVLTNYGYPKDEVNSIFKNWTSKDRTLKWWGLTKVSAKWGRKYYPLLALELCRIKWGEPRRTASRHEQAPLHSIAGGRSR